MIHHLIVRLIARLLIPVILLFAFYVQFHGAYGPGGGFQAGVIFSAALILYGLVFGIDRAQAVLSLPLLKILAALGVLLYAGVGVTTLVLGGKYLDYNVLSTLPRSGQHLGIALIEFGVGLTVASVMLILFYLFAQGSDDSHD